MRFPKTLQEFQTRFPDEEACWEALRRARWPRGFECPRCQGRRSSWIATRRLEQCAECRYQCSVTAGTVFHRTRVPLRTWFWAIFFLGRHKKGISALQLQRDTGLGSYETAWTMLHKLRSALRPRPAHRLIGDVEADETYVGGYRPGQVGRGLGKTGVAVAVENRGDVAGATRLAVVPYASTQELTSFVRGVIDAREARVHTDGWQAYAALARQGVVHRPRIQGHGPRARKILPWAHTVISNLKTWLRGTFHGVSPKHLPRYLDEFVYRFDRRWREDELGGFVLRRAAQAAPLPYRILTAEAAG
jgi:transposase-like protein